jgi:hypothetical protein
MSTYQQNFERIELKYLLTDPQYRAIRAYLADRTVPDRFAESDILNIYYDTPDSRIIRTSLAKPPYKEKLRLRCYKVPESTTPAFVELKKKYGGIVYKRRVSLPYQAATEWLSRLDTPVTVSQDDGTGKQICREIRSFFAMYPNLRPAMAVSYHRVALVGRDDPDFRITFDTDITARTTRLGLENGMAGEALLPSGTHLMELKVADAIPLPLSRELSRLSVFQNSFSKYGTGYLNLVAANTAPTFAGRYVTEPARRRAPHHAAAEKAAV